MIVKRVKDCSLKPYNSRKITSQNTFKIIFVHFSIYCIEDKMEKRVIWVKRVLRLTLPQTISRGKGYSKALG